MTEAEDERQWFILPGSEKARILSKVAADDAGGTENPIRTDLYADPPHSLRELRVTKPRANPTVPEVSKL